MTRFEEKFPDAKPGTYVDVEGDQVIKGEKIGFCWDCGTETRWVTTSFGTYICQESCLNNKWNEYWGATHERQE